MKKYLSLTILIFTLSLTFPTFSFTQGMMGNSATVSDGHTAREEAEGKAVWEKLQAKELACKDLSDDHFGTLGEYFMGQMMGTSHAAMNTRMIQMMGEQGEEQMHIALGKRMSNCEPNAPMPQTMMNNGMMPMMNMMIPLRQGFGGQVGGWSSPSALNQGNNSMMNFGFTPFGGFGWIFMILWWVLIIAGIVALIQWLMVQSHGTPGHKKSPLEILKERYAKGEIDKKEFEEKSRDIKNL